MCDKFWIRLWQNKSNNTENNGLVKMQRISQNPANILDGELCNKG